MNTYNFLSVGMGATINYFSDSVATTIIQIEGKRIILQRDKATRIDDNGFSDAQEYSYQQDPEGETYIASLRKDGTYRLVKSNSKITIGVRKEFYDYTF